MFMTYCLSRSCSCFSSFSYFISCHLLVTSYILITYIFMYFIRLSYLMTYTNKFLYVYVLLVLYQTVLSPVGVQNRDASFDTRRYFSYLYYFTYQIYIYCYFLFISTFFLPCIPINFNRANNTLGTTIQF